MVPFCGAKVFVGHFNNFQSCRSCPRMAADDTTIDHARAMACTDVHFCAGVHHSLQW